MASNSPAQAGLRGWRGTVANAVAPAVSKRSGLSEDQVKAIVSLAFLALSAMYLAKSAKDILAAFNSSAD